MTNQEKIEILNRIGFKDDQYINSLPKKLYKYRPFDQYTYDMLENKYLYLCPAKDLDDETECNVTLEGLNLYDLENESIKSQMINEIIDYIKPFAKIEDIEKAKKIIYSCVDKKGNIHRNNLLDISFELKEYFPEDDVIDLVNYLGTIPGLINDDEIKNIFYQSINAAYFAKKKLGICSLAESETNEYMWENYADKEKGYCVEYDMIEYEYIKYLFPVIYDDNRQTNILKQLTLSIMGQSIYGMSYKKVKPDISQYIRLFLSKNKKWEYQNEWRLLGDAKEKISAPKIRRIFLGKNVSVDNKEKIIDFCNKNNIEFIIRQ